MKNLSRRNFLALTLVSATSLMAVSPTLYTINKRDRVQSILPPQMLNECEAVYMAWSQKEELMPTHYFFSSMKNYGLDPWKISEAAKLDFQYLRFFDVGGLQLSKTEAAFLAFLGESQVA